MLLLFDFRQYKQVKETRYAQDSSSETMTAITGRRRRRRLCFFVYCAALLATITGNAERTSKEIRNGNMAAVTETTPGGYVQLDVVMKNMTKYEGDTLRVKCEITGYPLPRYQWLKNGVLLDILPSTDGHYNVRTTHWGCRLKIAQLTMEDAGSYMCVGFNQYGRESTSGELVIKEGPNPNRGLTKPERDPLDLDFDLEVDGFDADIEPPIYHQHLYPEGGMRPGAHSTTPSLGWYRQSNVDYDDNDDDYDEGFCQPYRGVTCSRFIGNKSIYVKDEYQQGQMEERLATAFTLLATIPGGLSTSCGQFAIPVMCFYSFPFCDDRVKPPQPRFLCREDCDRLATGHCRSEYATTQAAKMAANHVADTKLQLPDCSKSSESGNNCVSIGIPRFIDRGMTCYNGTGRDYKGFASRTLSGLECQQWGSVKNPFEPSILSISLHPELDHNFCRNADQSLEGPWCYTLSGDKMVKELCALEKCPGSSTVEDDEGLTKTLVVLVPCISVAILIAVAAAVVQFTRRKKLAKRQAFLGSNKQNKIQMSALLKVAPNYQELSLSSIAFVEELGEGRFGKVYLGEMISFGRLPVAVRTISPSAPWKTQAEFWNEIERLAEMLHPNITCLVGVVTTDIPASIVQEYSSTGDLHVYLTTNGRAAPGDVGGESSFLQLKDLFSISIQAAAGMEYLSNMSFVHRDLAARSVIMADSGLVKVSTVRFLNGAYAGDYYQPPGRSQPIPIRWLPPEAVFQDHFSSSTDIWSFGVLLWEIFSFGQLPYCGHTDESTVELIGYHQILPCPADCDSRIYSLMVECWHKIPSKRPDFRNVHASLRQLGMELPGQTELLVCQMFPRSANSGNSQGYTATTNTLNVDSVDQRTLMVPEVGCQQQQHGFFSPVQHCGYPPRILNAVLPHPTHQTPVYKKRPLPTSSSSQKSSPPSSLCSSQNPYSHIGSDYSAVLENRPFGQDPSSTKCMDTMYEDVVI